MAQVKLKDLKKVYGKDVLAVNNANIQIEDKEFIVLVGPSGCGKSTLLRMIAGLEEITDGALLIDDKKVNDISPKDRDIAMVFQNYALYPRILPSRTYFVALCRRISLFVFVFLLSLSLFSAFSAKESRTQL